MLDKQFKECLMKTIEPFRLKSRFSEDCQAIECIIVGGAYGRKSFQSSYDLVLGLKCYFKTAMKSHQRQFLIWSFRVKPEDNELVIALTEVFLKHASAAVHREMKQAGFGEAGVVAKRLRALVSENEKLKKELGIKTALVDTVQAKYEDQKGYIEALTKENKNLRLASAETMRQAKLSSMKSEMAQKELSEVKEELFDLKKQLAFVMARIEKMETGNAVHQEAGCLMEDTAQRKQSASVCHNVSLQPAVSQKSVRVF
jgi:hypothetical protein